MTAIESQVLRTPQATFAPSACTTMVCPSTSAIVFPTPLIVISLLSPEQVMPAPHEVVPSEVEVYFEPAVHGSALEAGAQKCEPVPAAPSSQEVPAWMWTPWSVWPVRTEPPADFTANEQPAARYHCLRSRCVPPRRPPTRAPSDCALLHLDG